MPLHLLGKKSWNVYNADNIARVRRDEAAAKAAEDAEEQRMQEVDAQHRLAILRGEVPPPLEDNDDETIKNESRQQKPSLETRVPRRKRKLQGEDDTEFELRLAKERHEDAHTALEPARKKMATSAPIVDSRGHISLFGDEKARAHSQKNEEAEREAQKKRREYEDQYTMRLSNAAGKEGLTKPWYSQEDAQDGPLKDVWGNDDPRRKQRDANRIEANDPLAVMKKGASRVRELKQERKRLLEERERELEQLRREDRRREKHRRRRRRSRESGRDEQDERHRSEHRRDEGSSRSVRHCGHEYHDR